MFNIFKYVQKWDVTNMSIRFLKSWWIMWNRLCFNQVFQSHKPGRYTVITEKHEAKPASIVWWHVMVDVSFLYIVSIWVSFFPSRSLPGMEQWISNPNIQTRPKRDSTFATVLVGYDGKLQRTWYMNWQCPKSNQTKVIMNTFTRCIICIAPQVVNVLIYTV